MQTADFTLLYMLKNDWLLLNNFWDKTLFDVLIEWHVLDI